MENKPIKDGTISELRDALTVIIDREGGDLEWNGFDNESIYIYPSDGAEYRGSYEITPGGA